MTSHIKATIQHNFPITVTKESGDYRQVIYQSDGEPGAYVGAMTYELDEGFSGDQVIIVRETPKGDSNGQ